MKTGQLTDKMKQMLVAVDDYGMEGTIEMFTQFGEYTAPGEEHECTERSWNLTRFVCLGVIRALKKRGLIQGELSSLELTDAGRVELEKISQSK